MPPADISQWVPEIMALFRVQALYDFVGESNSAELSITAGETLSVTRVDIGEGWWEGTNSQGQSGLFPQAYVSKLEDSAPPSIPPPALPPQASDWTPGGSQQDDDWDDEWDNDDTYSEIANNAQRESHYSNEPNQNQYNYGSGQVDNISESNFSVDNRGTVTKKSLNIFSSYVKSGLESYIFGNVYSFDAITNLNHLPYMSQYCNDFTSQYLPKPIAQTR